MPETIRYDRRRFIGTAVMATAGAGLVGSGLRTPGRLDESSLAATKPRTNGSMGPIKQIDAGHLKVGYTEAGPSNGPPAILLHGWPHSINSYFDVAPFAARGYRVIVPYVRGVGSTRFASSDKTRIGQPTAVASDVMSLMHALKIEKALVGGFDGGARAAEVMAALWPQQVKAIVPVSGYVVVNLAANQRPLPPKEELAWWYQYYFAPAAR
jgi:pimeloyl-ACP methyl ester carboxylesterase